MTIIKKYALLVAGIVCCSQLTAQITLTQSVFPLAGDVFTLQLCDTTGISTGVTGANVSWNYGNVASNGTNLVDSFKTVTTTMYGSNYPQANLAVHETYPGTNYYSFFNETGSFVERVGNADTMNVITYSDPANQYYYPVTYGDSWSDTYAAQFQSGTSTIYYFGNGTAVADGYGTLTTPLGTYQNVLRIKYERIETDSIVDTGQTLIFQQHVTYYHWYQSNKYYPIFSITTSVLSSPFFTTYKKTVGYRAGVVTGIEESDGDASIQVIDDVRNHQLLITGNDSKRMDVQVFNATGQLLKSLSGSSPMHIATETFTNGIFFITIRKGEHMLKKKFVIW